MGAYTTAKWGQLGLVRTLQLETRDLPRRARLRGRPRRGRHPDLLPGGHRHREHGQATTAGLLPRPGARAIVARVDQPAASSVGTLNPVIVAGFRLFPAGVRSAGRAAARRLGSLERRAAPTDGNVFEPWPDTEATEGRWRSI